MLSSHFKGLNIHRTNAILRLSLLVFSCLEQMNASSTYSLRLHLIRLPNDLVRSSLDDTARLGQLSADTHEIGVDVASGLATFIDAPAQY